MLEIIAGILAKICDAQALFMDRLGGLERRLYAMMQKKRRF